MSGKRWITLAALMLAIALMALGWRLLDSSAPARSDAEPATASQAPAGLVPAPDNDAAAHKALPALPAAPGVEAGDTSVVALQARDERRRAAIGRFHGAILAELNRCLPQRPGPRSPQQLVVHFVRALDAADDPAHPRTNETFQVSGIEPVGVPPGQASPRGTPAWACFEGLSGTKLEIPSGAGKQPAQFRELFTLPLPASVGWAQRGLPGPKIP